MDAKLFGLHSAGMEKTRAVSLQPERLRDLREKVHGFTGRGGQKRFAEELGIDPKRWNNFERGFPLSKEVEDRLVAITPGLSINWLRTGEDDRMPLDLARKLGIIPDRVSRLGRSSSR